MSPADVEHIEDILDDVESQASPENRDEWSDHNIPKTGRGDGDSRLTPEGRAALLALVENDDFGEYLDDVCSDESDLFQ